MSHNNLHINKIKGKVVKLTFNCVPIVSIKESKPPPTLLALEIGRTNEDSVSCDTVEAMDMSDFEDRALPGL